MDDDAILKLLFSDPDTVFFLYERGGGDYTDLKAKKIGKLFAQKKFPEIVEKEYTEAVEFMFWLSYFVERDITETIVKIEITIKRLSKEEAELKLDQMDFGDKIQFLLDKKYVIEDDPYITVVRKIKKLRNHMAHGRLHELVYSGHPLSHPKGQIKLTVDLHNALLRRKSKGQADPNVDTLKTHGQEPLQNI